MIELRAAAARQAPGASPNGAARSQPFKAQLRAQLVDFNGEERFRLHGHASIVERAYEMWDMFGPYTEIVARGAFDDTLAANPDVAFLVNHRGVTMARTTNGTLELSVDELGLASLAHLNPKRQDVQDLIHAIDDRNITEMSFAFMIDDGGWSDDFETFTIHRVNIDRGDVSAVNYGANPYTSIAARAHEIIDSLGQLPAGAARAALRSLQNRADMKLNLQQPPLAGQSEGGPASQNGTADPSTDDTRDRGQSESQRTGRSTSLIANMLALETAEAE
jgi:HK97 family phage prohead protease